MRKGYTVLELLVAMIIIGVLALISIPPILNSTVRTKNSIVKANARTVETSLYSNLLFSKAGDYSDIIEELIQNLNEDSKNPYDTDKPAYVSTGQERGSIVVVLGETSIDINGYGEVNGKKLITKRISLMGE